MPDSIYDIEVQALTGEKLTMAAFRGKALLIVNVASKCGFTPQYEGLQKLYDRYADQGFEVLGFPCNQFGKQEPGTEGEIGAFCEKNYGVTFPMFAKVDVNGGGAHPLYEHLRTEKGGILGDAIKWNFTKFLVSPDGEVLKRYAPTTTPEDIAGDVEKALPREESSGAIASP